MAPTWAGPGLLNIKLTRFRRRRRGSSATDKSGSHHSGAVQQNGHQNQSGAHLQGPAQHRVPRQEAGQGHPGDPTGRSLSAPRGGSDQLGCQFPRRGQFQTGCHCGPVFCRVSKYVVQLMPINY